MMLKRSVVLGLGLVVLLMTLPGQAAEPFMPHWVWTKAHAIPKETTSEGSGYFSIVEGQNGKLYIGTAKYRHNAYLVEFDPTTKKMNVVVDAHKEIGTEATGFAAQAKIHTRNNVGQSGKIYFGTKQGYPKEGETRKDYLGGYPMIYDPKTQTTRVYDIPIPHHGVISVTPDESRGLAYISTSSDERPTDSTHFMVLDIETGKYKDLMDCKHMYAFVVVDHKGRAYHPILGGNIARYNPDTQKLKRLKQTIDGSPIGKDSLLAHPTGHPINWDISPDRKTLYSVAMSGNQLYQYDLTTDGDTLNGVSLGPLVANAEKTDCRAMCVAPDGTVWAGVAVTMADKKQRLHVVSYRPGDKAARDYGPLAISNPDYTEFKDKNGKLMQWHHGVHQPEGEPLQPRYVVMGICAAKSGSVYVTTLYPFTVHEIKIPRVAGVTTVYYHNSHSDVLLSRLLQTDTLNFTGDVPPLDLASLYIDQFPKSDVGRQFSKDYQVPLYPSISKALTRGTGKLAVDGVMLIAEHGDYPESETGQIEYPKRRMFREITDTFRNSGKVVPVFSDKHLSDNWVDAKWIYDTAQEMKIPMMAGSSLPVLWRYPPIDVKRDAKVKEIVAISYHRLDTYGFHALEMVQALAERRKGGETGIQSVQCRVGDAVWEAEKDGVYDRKLLDAALSRLKARPLPTGKRIEELVREPVLFTINYRDGLKANVFTLNPAISEWAAAWREDEEPEIRSTLFWTQEARPYHHFNYFLRGIEKMMQTGKPTWPVERTLLTTGVLDAALISKRNGGKLLPTPHLNIPYQSDWDWQQPLPPPPGRGSREQ
ncbi:MAG: hypothetical protein KDA84_08925 [Planctomycetaceae bacterium]|nr:hypothetical protein [Planctomycetaceae bacterium]